MSNITEQSILSFKVQVSNNFVMMVNLVAHVEFFFMILFITQQESINHKICVSFFFFKNFAKF